MSEQITPESRRGRLAQRRSGLRSNPPTRRCSGGSVTIRPRSRLATYVHLLDGDLGDPLAMLLPSQSAGRGVNWHRPRSGIDDAQPVVRPALWSGAGATIKSTGETSRVSTVQTALQSAPGERPPHPCADVGDLRCSQVTSEVARMGSLVVRVSDWLTQGSATHGAWCQDFAPSATLAEATNRAAG